MRNRLRHTLVLATCAVASIALSTSRLLADEDATLVRVRPNIALPPALRQQPIQNSASSTGEGSNSVGGQRLMLSDIAEISGPLQEKLSSLALGPDFALPVRTSGSIAISLSEIRRTLEQAQVNLGRVSISGSDCTISLPTPTGDRPKLAGAQQPESQLPQMVDLTGPQTVRVLIAQRLASLYQVGGEDLRLSFDGADQSLLDEPAFTTIAGAPRRIDLQPLAASTSARVPVRVFAYEGERMTLSRVVTATALVRRTVVSATEVIERGQSISQGQFEIGQQWIAPSAKPGASAEDIDGAVAGNRLTPGQPVAQSDITQPIIVKRGDLVRVHALSGLVKINAEARALSAAKDGELVQLKLLGSEQAFTARMSGPGFAVLVVQPTIAEAGTPGTQPMARDSRGNLRLSPQRERAKGPRP